MDGLRCTKRARKGFKVKAQDGGGWSGVGATPSDLVFPGLQDRLDQVVDRVTLFKYESKV